jgi:phage baseplate assembly protein gpV
MVANSHIKTWTPPQVGEQVLVFSPYGEADDGIVLGGIYNVDLKEPTGANATTSVVEFSDGTVIKYDTSSKTLSILGSGSITVGAPNGINITADVNITGNLTVSGTVTDKKGSLTAHIHSGVMAGGSNTGDRS